MDDLAELIVRTTTAQDSGTAPAVFDTADPVVIAERIEGFVASRLAAVDQALFYTVGVGIVAGLALVDGSRIVVKVHRWNVTVERLRAVQRLQNHQLEAGLPAPRPLVAPEPLGHGIATAKELIVGRSADTRDASVRRTIARGLSDFITGASGFDDDRGSGAASDAQKPGGAAVARAPRCAL